MGDVSSPPAPGTCKPGIMLVRPSLRDKSDDNAATFRRWTAMHFRDLLSCSSPTHSRGGIVRALRYTNPAGDLFYTIHTDDISIFKTQSYYEISRRLDLENTRALSSDEVPVLCEEHSFGLNPMIWDITNAEFGIFEESKVVATDHLDGGPYHDVPAEFLSRSENNAPKCVLLTLTCTSDGAREEVSPEQVKSLQKRLGSFLQELYGASSRVFPSAYCHVQDAQPDMHPTVSKGEDGDGAWVICFLIEGEDYEGAQTRLQSRVENLVQEARETAREVDWDVKIGLWSGDLFLVK